MKYIKYVREKLNLYMCKSITLSSIVVGDGRGGKWDAIRATMSIDRENKKKKKVEIPAGCSQLSLPIDFR